MKILVTGDIHGRIDAVSTAIGKFVSEKYDKLIFLGDYMDSFSFSNEEMRECISLIIKMKELYKDRIVLLIGNHDLPYLTGNKEHASKGFRPDFFLDIYPFLGKYTKHFDYAFGEGDYLFTHAGVQLDWYLKYYSLIQRWSEKFELSLSNTRNISKIINGIGRTSDADILYEVGPRRGGYRSNKGGILWCDKKEIMDNGPLPNLHQVVGHTATPTIERHHMFGLKDNNCWYNTTSVTFIDVLETKMQFLTINTNEEKSNNKIKSLKESILTNSLSSEKQ